MNTDLPASPGSFDQLRSADVAAYLEWIVGQMSSHHLAYYRVQCLNVAQGLRDLGDAFHAEAGPRQ
jgi:hypothetical protein